MRVHLIRQIVDVEDRSIEATFFAVSEQALLETVGISTSSMQEMLTIVAAMMEVAMLDCDQTALLFPDGISNGSEHAGSGMIFENSSRTSRIIPEALQYHSQSILKLVPPRPQ